MHDERLQAGRPEGCQKRRLCPLFNKSAVFSDGFKVLYHRDDIFAKEFLAGGYRCLMEINQPSRCSKTG
jgi:hypothetical protein